MKIALYFFVAALAFVIGLLYGRMIERELVGATLAEFAKVDAAARSTFNRLSNRLGYLKKYF